MKWFTRIVIVGSIGFICWWAQPTIMQKFHAQISLWKSRRDIDDTVRSMAYPIDSSRWLEFALPSQVAGLRLLTNAAVAHTDLPSINEQHPRLGWNYAVQFELLDDQGQTIGRRNYHLRTRMIHQREAEVDEVEAKAWFQDSHLIPAQTRTIPIALPSVQKPASRIRIRLATHDSQIEEVVTRVYFKHEREDYQQAYTWSRLSSDARERLCRASVYPPDLVSPWERRNLLRWNWTALPPQGRRDVDYQQRLIYQVERPQAIDQEFLPPPDGIACKPLAPVTILTPATPGIARLEFFPDYELMSDRPAFIDLQIHRKILGTIAHQRYALDDLQQPLDVETSGDLLEVTTSDFMVCSATWQPRSTGEAATPLALKSSSENIRAYLTDKADGVGYRITHVNGESTPVRVTLRRLLPVSPQNGVPSWPDEISPANVKYDVLDDKDRTLHQGTLATLPNVARYDRASIGMAAMHVSEPATFYFVLPPAATELRFRCDDPRVAVIASTRPTDLPRTFHIPEEQGEFERQAEIDRTWFLFRPDDYRQRVADNRCANLSIQSRPPEANDRLLTGSYEWEDHRPLEFAVGRYVFTQRNAQLPLRDESEHLAYIQLPVNRDLSVRWRADDEQAALEPRLLFALPQLDQQPLQVFVDGRLYYQFVPRAQRGEVSLPARAHSADAVTLRLVAPEGSQIFLRNVEVPDSPNYIKRFVYELEEDPLAFDLVKHTESEEQFVLRTFFTAGSDAPDLKPGIESASDTGRHRIQVTLQTDLTDSIASQGFGPFEGWTLRQRIYDIAPNFDEPAILFPGTLGRVDQGALCVVVLGKDLPPGKYRLQVRRQQHDALPAYVSLYRTRDPDPSRRDARLEFWLTPSHTEAVSTLTAPRPGRSTSRSIGGANVAPKTTNVGEVR